MQLPKPTLPRHCTLCPRACGANRAAGQTGVCGAGSVLRAARAALHHWEEPCLSGDPQAPTGSGTVFFSGCALGCCYCQNYPISQEGAGRDISAGRLAEIFLALQQQGAKNINLVTATQWLPWVLPALDAARAGGLGAAGGVQHRRVRNGGDGAGAGAVCGHLADRLQIRLPRPGGRTFPRAGLPPPPPKPRCARCWRRPARRCTTTKATCSAG